MVITKDNFQAEIMESEIPVLVDFWAAWCGPCRMLSPIIDQIEAEYKGRIKVGKIDVDAQGELATQYSIMTIPTLIMFSKGEIADRLQGATKASIEAMINKHI